MKVSRKSCFCMLMALVVTSVLVVTLGYRLLQSDTASMPLPLPHAQGTELSGNEAAADFRFVYKWNLKDCPTDTEVLGALEPTVAELVEGDAIWNIELAAVNGKLTLKADAPRLKASHPFCKIHGRFCVTEKPAVRLRMPDTTQHTQRHFVLACELTADYGFGFSKQTIYLQEMVVDLCDAAADLQQPTIPPSLSRLPRHHIQLGAPSGLPERFCGTPIERELMRYLFYLAMVEDAGTAAAILPGLERRGRQLVDSHTAKDAHWPDCWGIGTETARGLARKVRPLLQHMQEHNCYNSADLAEFVNGEVFSRIFGPPGAAEE